ncbi:winged helix-turn-helix domain-containing protein [Streptacidiphilus cavernicola]|uniref:Winged helix-turn-helix domain-containing protein n=1 Tax=Streptacidiphilus cavernicola TaxID=3342716 RepID=A0ABV6VN35_9ACTN
MSSGPRTSVQVAYDALREEIERLGPGGKLSSQHELAEQLDVSRDTVQRALRKLRDEGRIHPVQGQGTFVADGPETGGRLEPAIIGLADYLDRAFQEPRVSIDFFGFTAETLATLLKLRLDRLRVPGRSGPESLTVRLLLPATGTHLALPRSIEDWADERPLNRLREMTAGFVRGMDTSISDIGARGLIGRVDLQVRAVRMTPSVKLYIINGTTALQSWYEVQRNVVELPSVGGGDPEMLPIHDLMGIEAPLIPQSPEGVSVAQRWFDSLWDTIATEWPGEGDALV